MTEKQADKAHKVYQKLWQEIHDLVDRRVTKFTPEQEDYVRVKLHEEFRFWGRSK